jgi:hypothetical protein
MFQSYYRAMRAAWGSRRGSEASSVTMIAAGKGRAADRFAAAHALARGNVVLVRGRVQLRLQQRDQGAIVVQRPPQLALSREAALLSPVSGL